MPSNVSCVRARDEAGLLDDALSVPTEEAVVHCSQKRQAAVSRRGSLHPGRGKWQV